MKSPPRGPSLRPSRPMIVVLPVMTLLASGCSSGDMETAPRADEPPPRSQDTDPPMPAASAQQADGQASPTQASPTQASAALLRSCANDDVRVCTHYLPEHNGVRQCIVGYQICSDNEWGPCIEGVAIDGGSPREPERSF